MTTSSLIIFFVILFFLVVIHELGHFLFAKLMKMRVDEFAFGFPPGLLSKKIGETVYSFNLIPLGGYVKIFGENGLTEEERNKLSPEEKKQLFGSKSIAARLLVLSGGVLFNIFGAIILFTIAFSIGTKVYIEESELASFVGNREIILTNIDSKSSLNNTQIKLGDKILSLEANGEKISLENSGANFNRVLLREFIQKHNDAIIKIEFKNPETNTTGVVEAIPKPGIMEGKKILGVEFSDIGDAKLNIFDAFIKGIKTSFYQILNILVGLYDLIRNLIFHDAKVEDNLSGPIGLAVLTGKVSERGIDQIFMFAAMLSLSLAVFNFLPIPALDGGRIVFVLIEAITRKKVKVEVEQLVHGFGFLLLLMLMVFVSYFDLVKAMAF